MNLKKKNLKSNKPEIKLRRKSEKTGKEVDRQRIQFKFRFL